ncbi:MAG: hypothetical protein HC838_03715 [Spirulinaceae cyanobacterium RM2_2_10]|nr:hypothetical protein [Spirulinaceae cyanobacterium SM2_1_0]NJO19350.1 hypothetical protein [Spirulinaceae cyanobacterium RM2_2_10]
MYRPSGRFPFYASKEWGPALVGSLRLLKPELDREATNTPDDFDEVVETYTELLSKDGWQLNDDPEREADDFQVHKVTADGSGAERYLHLIQHYGRTIIVVTPDSLTRSALERQDLNTDDDEQALEQVIEAVKATHLTAEADLDELERFSGWPTTSASCTLQGQTRDRAAFPASALKRQLDQELALSTLYSRENRLFYPGARLYTVMNATKTFARYLILTPVAGDRGTALLSCKELPGYASPNGR